MLALLSSLIVSTALDVPYLPQTESLCGGAAVAMVLRYWGDTHADPQQFAALVDARAGGIADAALVTEVKRRGWQAAQLVGSMDLLREEIQKQRPVILLIQDRPRRYHYVVVTGVTDQEVVVHDPARGPSRRISLQSLLRAWEPTGFRALVIAPVAQHEPPTSPAREPDASGAPIEAGQEQAHVEPASATSPANDNCDLLLSRAVDEIRQIGIGSADSILNPIRVRCPGTPGPVRELAGVRFAQHRWKEAATLAQQAIELGDTDAYAWELLASSRYMQDDLSGALLAWNRLGKPRINLVRIAGVRRTRYALLGDILGLSPNTVLTAEMFRRAERRLHQLPDQSVARITYHLERDGYATVDVTVVERATLPRQPLDWAAASARGAIDREVSAAVPGSTGQGELWAASWRWWNERPRAALAFVAPRAGRVGGVWRVEGAWEAQTYAPGAALAADPLVRETRAHGAVAVGDWIASNLRYDLTMGLDQWNGSRRTASVGAALDRRFANDHVTVAGDLIAWVPFSNEPAFGEASVRVGARSSDGWTGWAFVADAGANLVSAAAPYALWPAAGEGHAREQLLRAHPLLRDGVVAGSMFGRALVYGNTEARRWIDQPLPIGVGIAGFADLARASSRGAFGAGQPFQVDVGIGLRLKVPGANGTLRVDLGYGLRDAAHALTFGWEL